MMFASSFARSSDLEPLLRARRQARKKSACSFGIPILIYHYKRRTASRQTGRWRQNEETGMLEGIEAHRWMMTGVNQPMVREALRGDAGRWRGCRRRRRLRRLPYRSRLFLRRRAHQSSLGAGARPRDFRARRRRGRRRAILARPRGDHSRRSALRRMRRLQAGSAEHLPQAEDARQRHSRRLRLAYRRAGARPLPSGRNPARLARPVACRCERRRRRRDDAVSGRGARRRDARARWRSSSASAASAAIRRRSPGRSAPR